MGSSGLSGTWVGADNVALFTDLYELTMAQAYVANGLATREATFSLFARTLPAQRNYLLACGLDSVLGYLESLQFTDDNIAYLRALKRFSPEFLDWLRGFRFTGDVVAVPEGTPVFAGVPMLEITAPLAEAQIVETFVMNQMHVQTVQASKAARVVAAAAGRTVVDFGARRMHGTDAAIKAARACAIAGVSGTSNVLAAQMYGLTPVGTMAHSYVQAYGSELEALRTFARQYPGTTLLVDTYDTLRGVRHAVEIAQELGPGAVTAVRLDSGDLAVLSRGARAILDEAGLPRVEIFASGGLDEYAIADLMAKQAPINGFGVGTRMGVSEDAPSFDIVYKMTECAGQGRLKRSTGKEVLPGRKQVFRDEYRGSSAGDTIARAEERLFGRALLQPVMSEGKRLLAGRVSLDTARAYAKVEIAKLPPPVRGLVPAQPPYPVMISPELTAYAKSVAAELR